jgi:hypothetical protein
MESSVVRPSRLESSLPKNRPACPAMVEPEPLKNVNDVRVRLPSTTKQSGMTVRFPSRSGGWKGQETTDARLRVMSCIALYCLRDKVTLQITVFYPCYKIEMVQKMY